MRRSPPSSMRRFGTRQVTPENRRTVIPRNYRMLRDWTQTAAAEHLGVHVRTYRRWEATGAPPWALKRMRDYAIHTCPEFRDLLS